MKIYPVSLVGMIITLEPLSFSHVEGLSEVGLDERIWRHMLYGEIRTKEEMRVWVQDLLDRQASGTDLPFAAILNKNMKAIGATRYLNIDLENSNLEIGGTWYGVAYQGTGVNTETKYLLLRHAFEELECVRVQLKTDIHNLHSQRAIERLGAKREGVLRKHIVRPDGRYRDSVYYSILDTEWPLVKSKLEELLGRSG